MKFQSIGNVIINKETDQQIATVIRSECANVIARLLNKDHLMKELEKKCSELERAERLKLEFQNKGDMELSRTASHRADELSFKIRQLQAQLSEVSE